MAACWSVSYFYDDLLQASSSSEIFQKVRLEGMVTVEYILESNIILFLETMPVDSLSLTYR